MHTEKKQEESTCPVPHCLLGSLLIRQVELTMTLDLERVDVTPKWSQVERKTGYSLGS